MKTRKYFKYFIARCKHWQKYFGLLDYEIHYYNDKEWSNESRADINGDVGGGIASINLSLEWDAEPTKTELNRVAFHEINELLLAKLSYLIRERFIDEKQIQAEIHAVIRRLENAILGDNVS